MEEAFPIHVVRRFDDYLRLILDLPPRPLTLYRGQAQDRPLLPKIARFRLQDSTAVEKAMLDDFRRRSLHLIHHLPGNAWDWLALAQHHGMATRLLDWSENPLNALWFSIASTAPQAPYAVVWGLKVPPEDIIHHTENLDPFEGGQTQVFLPNHITPRITAQFGWFTIHKPDAQHCFIPFEKNDVYVRHLFKFEIDRRCFSECQHQLHRFGINAASLYPDIDGLARHVAWLYLDDL